MTACTESASGDTDFTVSISISTASTSEFIPIGFTSLVCPWFSYFDMPEELKEFENKLRISGYRKDVFKDKPVLNLGVTKKEFRRSDHRIKLQHRDWRGKEWASF